ncbi:hypothetical protein ES708_01611 [subsurface metagenome]
MALLSQKLQAGYRNAIIKISEDFTIAKSSKTKKGEKNRSLFSEIYAHRFMGQVLGICCLTRDNLRNKMESVDKEHRFIMNEDVLAFFTLFRKNSTHLMFNIENIHRVFLKTYSTDASAVISFLSRKSLVDTMEQVKISPKFVEEIINSLWNPISESIPEMTNMQALPEILSNLFESSGLSGQKSRIKEGVFYTPVQEIIFSCIWTMQAYMNNITRLYGPPGRSDMFQTIAELFSLSPYWEQIDSQSVKIILKYTCDINILDPACGSGAFLEPFIIFYSNLFHYLSTPLRGSQSGEDIPSQIEKISIIGTDINPWALELASFRLNLKLHVRGYDHILNTDFFCCDFLLDRSKLAEKYEKFHIIIGNPPYIRNRDITDPSGSNAQHPGLYRQKIKDGLKIIPEITESDTTRIDYYLYFFYHGLNLLAHKGVLCYITSNSWMNVRFGYLFQEFLLNNYFPQLYFDNTSRSFQSADINTVISIIGDARYNRKARNNNAFEFLEYCLFIRLEMSFSDVLKDRKIMSALFTDYKDITKYFRPRPTLPQILEKHGFYRLLNASREDMLTFESGKSRPRSNHYKGYAWGKYYFNATPLIFRLNDQIGQNLVLLGDIGKISRGITTNCNDFFVLKKMDESNLPYENGYGDRVFIESEILTPFLTSPRQLVTKKIDSNQVATFLLYTDLSLDELEKQNFSAAAQYIKRGMKKEIFIKKGAKKGQKIKGVHNLKSFQARYSSNPARWFCLKQKTNQNQKSKQIIFQKIYNTTYKLAIAPMDLVPNNTFYKLKLNKEPNYDIDYIFALLQSSLTFLSLELEGRTNFGGGALDTATFDIEKIMLLNPSILPTGFKSRVIKIAEHIIDECYYPLEVEFKKAPRRELDRIILDHLDGDFELDDLYRDISSIQSKRISKSDTFKK